ncbi:MAG: hypothetical protein JJW00_03735 [Sulfurimonas sp.]|nr:hypothetical protein [Sulfurimonas sp.]
MSRYTTDALSYYIEFAKADSKLACVVSHKDFKHLNSVLLKFANVFEDDFSFDEYRSLIDIYLSYMVTYFKKIRDIAQVKSSENIALINAKIKSFKETNTIEDALKAISLLRTEIEIQENYNGNSYHVSYRAIKTKFKIDQKKIISASTHYRLFFDTYKKYDTTQKYISKQDKKYHKLMMSNITCISEFHQAITHLSRYVNTGHEREIYRFDSHIIRAIFDTQKLIIASLDRYSREIDLKDKNKLLLDYINVKNIEVPGRNMSNFHQVYTRYNTVIDSYIKALF